MNKSKQPPASEGSDSDLVWETLREPAQKVSQGDLFYFEDEQPHCRYGIVVTADCDLANRKHSRLVSLVPLLELDDLLVNCLYIDHLEKLSETIALLLRKELASDVSINDPAFKATVEAALNEASEIPAEIAVAAEIFLERSDQIDNHTFQALLDRMNIPKSNVYKRFEQQIKSRGDIVPLARPPYSPHDARIAWLRRVFQVPIGKLMLRTSQYVPGSTQGQHVARLASPFRYRLTQQFSQVFSDIGTPNVSTEWIGTNLMELVK
ncbi:hypothetical protein [Synechococcus sp. CBW1107]|uniref:hypothetical protein n=1 Tax=Synechococcus sp. CBW1107 TaxID=2789857 RepID=UPI002AD43947|nr:hypothetical protein [Synechococcus sp. CBW1107]CAK6697288.1 hypothetical protein ICNINCKA_02199 [Synechococcus sp. CBW1107]